MDSKPKDLEEAFWRKFKEAGKDEQFAVLVKLKNLLHEHAKEQSAQYNWQILRARFYGYNETTLSLIQHQDGDCYVIRTDNYPYLSNTQLNLDAIGGQPSTLNSEWNKKLHEATKSLNRPELLVNSLGSTPPIRCHSSDPIDVFERIAEEERFYSRRELRKKYEIDKPSLVRRWPFKSRFISNGFNSYADLNRTLWYHAQEILTPTDDDCEEVFLNIDETRKLITDVCNDFGVPFPRHTKVTSKLLWGHANGIYKYNTTDMFLVRQKEGIPKHTVLHELAHHIESVFGSERPLESAAHGFRFKKIHMHLAWKYGDVPAKMIMEDEPIQIAYCPSFPIREQDIVCRDFNEIRVVDIDTGSSQLKPSPFKP